MKYDIVYITSIPAFYKINLFNRIAKEKKILVIFLCDTHVERNSDFYKGERSFDFISIANRNFFLKFIFCFNSFFINHSEYREVIISGWDYLFYWIIALLSPIIKNSMVIESSYLESQSSGLKKWMKKMILSRISRVYASGRAQKKLVEKIGFRGEIIITQGVGIFNIVSQPKYKYKENINNFIFVGRLSKEKNLAYLIEVFNEFPQLTLNIIGFGPEEEYLKSISSSNIIFHGAVPNSSLKTYFCQNDVFILPSLREVWGLVVEEALNNGLPVIVSDKVGCAEEIVIADYNGLIFELGNTVDLKLKILKMADPLFYNKLSQNISKLDFNEVALKQTTCYLH